MSEDTLNLIKSVVATTAKPEAEPKEARMIYMSVGLFAELQTFVGAGNVSKVIESLVKENLAAWEKAGVIKKHHREAMTTAREAALKKAHSKKTRKRQ